jgi:hypothetical protein
MASGLSNLASGSQNGDQRQIVDRTGQFRRQRDPDGEK